MTNGNNSINNDKRYIPINLSSSLPFLSVLGRSRGEGLQYSTLRISLSVVPQPLLSHQISRSLSEQHMVNALKIVCWSFSLLYFFFLLLSLRLLSSFLVLLVPHFFIYCLILFSSFSACYSLFTAYPSSLLLILAPYLYF